MMYLLFLGGVILGAIITRIISNRKTISGHFRLDPVPGEEEDGSYNINIQIPDGRESVFRAKKIVLYKDDTQK